MRSMNFCELILQHTLNSKILGHCYSKSVIEADWGGKDFTMDAITWNLFYITEEWKFGGGSQIWPLNKSGISAQKAHQVTFSNIEILSF